MRMRTGLVGVVFLATCVTEPAVGAGGRVDIDTDITRPDFLYRRDPFVRLASVHGPRKVVVDAGSGGAVFPPSTCNSASSEAIVTNGINWQSMKAGLSGSHWFVIERSTRSTRITHTYPSSPALDAILEAYCAFQAGGDSSALENALVDALGSGVGEARRLALLFVGRPRTTFNYDPSASDLVRPLLGSLLPVLRSLALNDGLDLKERLAAAMHFSFWTDDPALLATTGLECARRLMRSRANTDGLDQELAYSIPLWPRRVVKDAFASRAADPDIKSLLEILFVVSDLDAVELRQRVELTEEMAQRDWEARQAVKEKLGLPPLPDRRPGDRPKRSLLQRW